MITIGEMQISGMLTMMMLSVMLMACVPNRSTHRSCFARARWMMAAGTGLIAVQFLLQYIFGFRQMGVTQAVCCNLMFFTPASLMCSMAVLYVQRQGHIAQKEWKTSRTGYYTAHRGGKAGAKAAPRMVDRECGQLLRIQQS